MEIKLASDTVVELMAAQHVVAGTALSDLRNHGASSTYYKDLYDRVVQRVVQRVESLKYKTITIGIDTIEVGMIVEIKTKYGVLRGRVDATSDSAYPQPTNVSTWRGGFALYRGNTMLLLGHGPYSADYSHY